MLELIAHVDAQIDAESLTRFRRRLSDGGAAETGRALGRSDHAAAGVDRESARITTGLAQGREDRDLANQWVERLQDDGGKKSVPSRHRGGGHGASRSRRCPVRSSRNFASVFRV